MNVHVRHRLSRGLPSVEPDVVAVRRVAFVKLCLHAVHERNQGRVLFRRCVKPSGDEAPGHHERVAWAHRERVTDGKAELVGGDVLCCRAIEEGTVHHARLYLVTRGPPHDAVRFWMSGASFTVEVFMLVFSYGSNLLPARQKTDFQEVDKALLLDHRLAFTWPSKTWEGGTLDVRPLLGSVVHGVVAEVDDMEALDKQEGAPDAYHRVTLPVTLDDGCVEAVAVYIVSKPKSFVPPAPEYLVLVREAYGLYGFPAEALEAAASGNTSSLVHKMLFVYGTLMRGESRNALLGGRQSLPARCRGTLLDLGPYPGLVEGKGRVQGEIVEVENADDMDKLLRHLDEVEGFLGHGVDGSDYERVLIEVDVGTLERRLAWTYRWLGEPGQRIRSGSWRTRRHARTDSAGASRR